MLRFRETIFELVSRAIILIKDFQSVISFFSKMDLILKTKDSLSIKAKRRSFDVKNKRSKLESNDQSIKRLKFRFEHIEKNLKTRRDNRDRESKKNKNERISKKRHR